MLYSISVNLPVHRAEQLDCVLVVASPINDINLHAWDINKVKRFIELDIGIRMELCHSCYRGRSMTTTFILEKQFVKDCIAFLCKQAQITDPPVVENGLFIYTVAHHRCSTSSTQDSNTPTITCTDRNEVSNENEPPPPIPPPPLPPRLPRKPSEASGSKSMEKSNSAVHVCINNSNDLTTTDDSRRSRCFTTTSVDVTFNTEQADPPLRPVKPAIPIPEYWDDYTGGSDSCTGGSGMESLFMTDGSLTKTALDPPPKDTKSLPAILPPRTIPRKNHESSIPAAEQPYYNFQPHLFNHHGNKCFDAPYQISSRIIIKGSGEVQFERNIMGNQPPKRHGGFHFKQQIPIPPRGLRADTDLRGKVTVGGSGTTCSSGGNPSLQTNFNFQSSASAAANVIGNGAQFSQEVSASANVSATVDMAAPPIPPRPSRKSSTNSHHSSRSTCKSPVPLPRSNISSPSSGVRKSTDLEAFIDNEAYSRHFISVGEQGTASHLAGLPQPKTYPQLPRQGVTFGPNRTDSDAELESISHHRRDGQSIGSVKSDASDESDAYVVPNSPPVGYSRSNSKNTLSPCYVDESQFLLETPPDYLKLVAMKKDADGGQTVLTDEQAESCILGEGNGLVPTNASTSSNSLEPDDKECDFEDAASIQFIQSSYRQRCGSSNSTPQGAVESSMSMFASYSTQISLENIQQSQTSAKPEVPPRKLSKPVTAKEMRVYENTSFASSQETHEQSEPAILCSTSSSASSVSTCTSSSDQSLLGSQSGETNDKEATKPTKPLPRPRSKTKVVLSKSLNVFSCSDSNLLESVNDTSSETNWSIRAGQKSTSLSTKFFLDDSGIGVSEL